MNPLFAPFSAPINRSIRRLYSVSSAELFMYTIVTQVNGVSSYLGWILKEEEFEDSFAVNLTNKSFGSTYSFLSLVYSASTKTLVFFMTRVELE